MEGFFTMATACKARKMTTRMQTQHSKYLRIEIYKGSIAILDRSSCHIYLLCSRAKGYLGSVQVASLAQPCIW